MSAEPAAPTTEQLAIARRIGNRLAERLPPSMDVSDVRQFATEALLVLIAEDKAPATPAHLSVVLRARTIDLLRQHGAMTRFSDGSYAPPERGLDGMPDYMRESLLEWEDAPRDESSSVGATAKRDRETMRVQASVARRHIDGLLTNRELEALGLVADGYTYPEAARLMGVSLSTIQNHLKAARRSLRARCTAHAVARAFRRGLLA